MANCRLIEFELPPVRHASQEGLVCFIGGDGGLHRGTGGDFTVGVSEVGRREKWNCGKNWAESVVGVNLFP